MDLVYNGGVCSAHGVPCLRWKISKIFAVFIHRLWKVGEKQVEMATTSCSKNGADKRTGGTGDVFYDDDIKGDWTPWPLVAFTNPMPPCKKPSVYVDYTPQL